MINSLLSQDSNKNSLLTQSFIDQIPDYMKGQINCNACEILYNLSDRIPMIICRQQHQICLSCLRDIMSKTELCPICHKEIDRSCIHKNIDTCKTMQNIANKRGKSYQIHPNPQNQFLQNVKNNNVRIIEDQKFLKQIQSNKIIKKELFNPASYFRPQQNKNSEQKIVPFQYNQNMLHAQQQYQRQLRQLRQLKGCKKLWWFLKRHPLITLLNIALLPLIFYDFYVGFISELSIFIDASDGIMGINIRNQMIIAGFIGLIQFTLFLGGLWFQINNPAKMIKNWKGVIVFLMFLRLFVYTIICIMNSTYISNSQSLQLSDQEANYLIQIEATVIICAVWIGLIILYLSFQQLKIVLYPAQNQLAQWQNQLDKLSFKVKNQCCHKFIAYFKSHPYLTYFMIMIICLFGYDVFNFVGIFFVFSLDQMYSKLCILLLSVPLVDLIYLTVYFMSWIYRYRSPSGSKNQRNCIILASIIIAYRFIAYPFILIGDPVEYVQTITQTLCFSVEYYDDHICTMIVFNSLATEAVIIFWILFILFHFVKKQLREKDEKQMIV